jgi:TolB-like protein/DNA-binding winged helix-turn-helix (wHTH) protein/Tfp pilus assembly protein PilF
MPEPTGPLQAVRFGVFEADLRSGELRKHGLRIKLQEQPFQILAMLLERPGEVVTREELRLKLWPGDTFVDFDHGLNNAINRLREALNDSADAPRFIETLPRRGYRFIAPVDNGTTERTQPSPSISSAERSELSGVTAPEKAAADITPLAVPRYRQRKFWLAAAAFAIAVALLVGLKLGRLQRLFGTNASARIQSIAVLPLENLTGDPAQEYFADGMTDTLITDLAQISGLRVISRTSVMRYKGAKKPLPQIARELNVDAVVEGAVSRSGGRIRITAQLIQAPTDQHLWARAYERDLGDILLLQSEVSRAIANQIQIKLTPLEQARLARARPVNPEAYEAYLQGRYFWNKFTQEGFVKAIQYFQQAIEKDPNYALAYSGLSDSYRFLGLGSSPPRDSMSKAAAAALKALEIDDTLAEAHASLAVVRYRRDWDWTGSETEFMRALELSPNYAEGHREYGVYLRMSGRFDEGLAEAKRAKEMDPLSLLMNTDVGAQFYAARQYDQAIEQLRKTLEMDPNFAMTHWWLGLAYEGKGDVPRALAALEKTVSLSGRNPLYLAFLGNAYAVSGQKSQAEKILAELRERSRRVYIQPYDMALIYAGLGNKEQALVWLEKAYEERSFSVITIGTWKQFDGLRADPRFRELVRRIMPTARGSAPQAPGETRK